MGPVEPVGPGTSLSGPVGPVAPKFAALPGGPVGPVNIPTNPQGAGWAPTSTGSTKTLIFCFIHTTYESKDTPLSRTATTPNAKAVSQHSLTWSGVMLVISTRSRSPLLVLILVRIS